MLTLPYESVPLELWPYRNSSSHFTRLKYEYSFLFPPRGRAPQQLKPSSSPSHLLRTSCIASLSLSPNKLALPREASRRHHKEPQQETMHLLPLKEPLKERCAGIPKYYTTAGVGVSAQMLMPGHCTREKSEIFWLPRSSII